MWDPTTYLAYAGPRARPFADLLARIAATDPRVVLDLGCGPGTLTADLRSRWPQARVVGVDSSPEMIDRACRHEEPGVIDFQLGDLRTWAPRSGQGAPDVIITNATLQWVPDHLPLLDRWIGWLPKGGWLALQVPANFDAPSHVIMREVAADPRWRDRLEPVLRFGDAVAAPEGYLERLASLGCEVDAWQTTYLHVLHGDDPVLEWTRGTGLRPVYAALGAEAADFESRYAAELRRAYPPQTYGTVFPFTRTFAVARKRGEGEAA